MPEVIASTLLLALAVKIKKIFEKEDKYVAFPQGLGFPYRSLEFMKDPSQTSLSLQEQLNYKGEFSRLFNIIPEDKAVFSLDAGWFLWDEVKRILTNCIFAKSGLTSDEEQQLSEAIDFLTDNEIGPDGSKVPVYSPQVSKYYEYKTLYDKANSIYLDEQLSVQCAQGEGAQQLKEKWNAYREKQLREARDKAEQDWINLGFKNQVERYMSLRNQLEVRKYLNVYGQTFLNDIKISEIADLNGQGVGFYTTFFSPSDAFDKGLSWISITLTKGEINGLLAEAPNDLRAVFGTGTDQSSINIETISFEYNNVILIRPWLKTEFFESRYWKLPDDTFLVSDGGRPCRGTLPAYITNLLVVRNVRITRKAAEPRPTLVLPLLSKTPIKTLQISKLPVKPLNLAMSAKLSTTAKTSFVRPAVVSNVAVPPGKIVRPQAFYVTAKFKGTTILTPRPRLDIMKSQAEGDPRRPPQTSQFVTENYSFEDDGVMVLALLCKRLPKAPNPDPTLQW